MKRILFTLFILCSVLCCMAQEQEHLTFKGIPIEGSMTSFCEKLKSKDFIQIGKDGNATLFVGDFTGKKATVAVASGDDGKDVFAVVVLLDPSDEWKTLVYTYDYYKELYTRKYGNPAISRENNPAYNDSNGSKMSEVYQGTVTWASHWEVTGGSIELSIEKSTGIYEGLVIIRYRDAQNVENKIQSDLEDI